MTQHAPQTWTAVCGEQDLIADSGIAVWTPAGPVALFWLPGQEDAVFAISHFCPKGQANVLARGIIGDLKGQLVVASPLYKQHYNLRTGQCLEDDTVKVATYPVQRLNGQILLGLTEAAECAA